jgi:hypothetical protein
MSFQNYEQYQGQPTGEQPNPAASQGDLGQPMDPQGNMGPPGSAGPDGNSQGAGKTTLW